jgi:hypothetical protein
VWLSASDHLLMDEDDSEKRIAELERRQAEPRAAGTPRKPATQDDARLAYSRAGPQHGFL